MCVNLRGLRLLRRSNLGGCVKGSVLPVKPLLFPTRIKSSQFQAGGCFPSRGRRKSEGRPVLSNLRQDIFNFRYISNLRQDIEQCAPEAGFNTGTANQTEKWPAPHVAIPWLSVGCRQGLHSRRAGEDYHMIYHPWFTWFTWTVLRPRQASKVKRDYWAQQSFLQFSIILQHWGLLARFLCFSLRSKLNICGALQRVARRHALSRSVHRHCQRKLEPKSYTDPFELVQIRD